MSTWPSIVGIIAIILSLTCGILARREQEKENEALRGALQQSPTNTIITNGTIHVVGGGK